MSFSKIAGKILFIIVMLFLWMVLMMIFTRMEHHRMNDRVVGHAITMFNIPELADPDTYFSPEIWKGKVAIINIFASWCGPCQAEHEKLLKLAQTTTVPIYGIAWHDRGINTKEFLYTRGNPYKIVALDELGHTTIPFLIKGIPETVIVGKDGIVRFHCIGALDNDIINGEMLPLLEKLNAK